MRTEPRRARARGPGGSRKKEAIAQHFPSHTLQGVLTPLELQIRSVTRRSSHTRGGETQENAPAPCPVQADLLESTVKESYGFRYVTLRGCLQVNDGWRTARKPGDRDGATETRRTGGVRARAPFTACKGHAACLFTATRTLRTACASQCWRGTVRVGESRSAPTPPNRDDDSNANSRSRWPRRSP